ncbi:MAG: hypothetical protein P4L30_10460 [Candidatus Limnocylindrales bacterium]|nr:hypothetical protein [Candidatus Limnocylindrales bacterium]
MSIQDRYKELARRLYVEVFDAGNLAAADEILAADCVSLALPRFDGQLDYAA